MQGYYLGKTSKSIESRKKKAKKIIQCIISEIGEKKAKKSNLLDIGTGSGYIAHEFSKLVKKVDSVDIVDDRKIKSGYSQKIVDSEILPYKDSVFDIVVTNQVLEHVTDHKLHLLEIKRVLKDDGIVYLASPNKWWYKDPHYKLPFISWMPNPVANKYLNITRKRKWDIRSLSLLKLNRLTKDVGFISSDKFWEVVESPDKYSLKVPNILTKIAVYSPNFVKNISLYFIPTHIRVLRKASTNKVS